jgi:hypothetical protein
MFIVKHAQRFKGPLHVKLCTLGMNTELNAHTLKVNGGTNTVYFWDDKTLSFGQQLAEDC